MKIDYKDEYGETIYTTQMGTSTIPRGGEWVVFKDEDYKVKSVYWVLEEDTVVVELTQNFLKKKEEGTEGRLNEVNSAILGLNKRLDKQEKKGKLLSEQLVSVRSYLRTKKN